MRLLSFTSRGAGHPSWGVLEDAGIVDLGVRPGLETPTLDEALRADGLMGIAMNAVGLAPDHRLADVTPLPVVPGSASRVLVETGNETGNGNSIVHQVDLAVSGRALDTAPGAPRSWQAGLAAVIGSPCRALSRDAVHEFIAGYTGVIHSGPGRPDRPGGVTAPDVLVTAPWLVTPDEFPGLPLAPSGGRGPRATLDAHVNGHLVGHWPLDPLLDRLAHVVADRSHRTGLDIGDLVAVTVAVPEPLAAGDRCTTHLHGPHGPYCTTLAEARPHATTRRPL